MKRSLRIAALLFSVGGAACGAKGPADVDKLDLPDNNYYPESLNVAADGTLYVGSLGTGQVVKFDPGATTSTPFVPTGVLKGVAGVLVDDAGGALYVCAVDLSQTNPTPATVRSFNLADGSAKGIYSFPSPAFCNDMAFDGNHNLYVADSYGKIYRLADGAPTLALWSMDSKLASVTPMGFGADGITWDGVGNLYVTAFTDGRLLRLPINADGSAGAAVEITVSPALSSPDGMRSLDATTLVLADGAAGRLTKLSVSGSTAAATALQTGLNAPTSVVKFDNYFWVSEGQLGHLFGQVAGAPTTPFELRRFPAN